MKHIIFLVVSETMCVFLLCEEISTTTTTPVPGPTPSPGPSPTPAPTPTPSTLRKTLLDIFIPAAGILVIAFLLYRWKKYRNQTQLPSAIYQRNAGEGAILRLQEEGENMELLNLYPEPNYYDTFV